MQLNYKFLHQRKIFIVIINVMFGLGVGGDVNPLFLFGPGPPAPGMFCPFDPTCPRPHRGQKEISGLASGSGRY